MSYDINLTAVPCHACGKRDHGFHIDPTYNLARIFHLAIAGSEYPDDKAGTFADVILGQRTPEPCGPEVLNGKTGAESLAVLDAALDRLRDPALAVQFHSLEPENRWGTLEDAVLVVGKMREAAIEFPNHVWDSR